MSSPTSPDLISQFFPWRYLGFRSLKAGTFPFWNPYIFGGSSFLAEIQTSMFYPLNLIFLFFPVHVSLTISEILHVYLAGLFTYFFVRSLKVSRVPSLLAALTFMFSAPVILHVYPGHVSNLCTLAWIPLLFLALEVFLRRKRAIFILALGAVFALQILAGHVQYVFYTSVGAFIYLIVRIFLDPDCRRRWFFLITGFFAAVALSAALTAVQLLVSMEAVRLSVRKELSFEFVSAFSFPPENILTLFIPALFGDWVHLTYWGRYYLWEMCLYVGIVPLILAAAALIQRANRYAMIFGVLALSTLVLALGKFTPLLKVLYLFVPGFNLFRGSSKFIVLTAFSLAVLAGFGAEFLIEAVRRGRKKKRLKQFALGTGVAAAILFFLIITIAAGGSEEGGLWRNFLEGSASLERRFNPMIDLTNPRAGRETFSFFLTGAAVCEIFLLAATALFFLAAGKKTKPAILAALVILLSVVDLGLFGIRYMVVRPLGHCFWEKKLVAFLQEDPEPYRVGLVHFSIPGMNKGMNNGIATVGGYGSNVTKRYSDFYNLSQGFPLDHIPLVMTVQRVSSLINLLNMKYLLIPARGEIKGHPFLEPVFATELVRVYQNLDCLPRTFLVHQAKVVGEEEKRFAELTRTGFEPRQCVILEEEPPVVLSGEGPAEESAPRIVEYGLNRVVIAAEPSADAFLVLADTWYPGWKVYVDGREEKLYCAYHTLRAVYLPPGSHRVEFVYSPLSFKLGAAVSLLTLTGSVVLAVVLFRGD